MDFIQAPDYRLRIHAEKIVYVPAYHFGGIQEPLAVAIYIGCYDGVAFI